MHSFLSRGIIKKACGTIPQAFMFLLSVPLIFSCFVIAEGGYVTDDGILAANVRTLDNGVRSCRKLRCLEAFKQIVAVFVCVLQNAAEGYRSFAARIFVVIMGSVL